MPGQRLVLEREFVQVEDCAGGAGEEIAVTAGSDYDCHHGRSAVAAIGNRNVKLLVGIHPITEFEIGVTDDCGIIVIIHELVGRIYDMETSLFIDGACRIIAPFVLVIVSFFPINGNAASNIVEAISIAKSIL